MPTRLVVWGNEYDIVPGSCTRKYLAPSDNQALFDTVSGPG